MEFRYHKMAQKLDQNNVAQSHEQNKPTSMS